MFLFVIHPLRGRRFWPAANRFVCCLVLIVLLQPLAHSAFAASESRERKTVRVGIYQNPPKCFVNANGEAAGIFVDIVQAVARAENWRLEFVRGTWIESLQRLQRGEIDLMPDVAHTQLREKLYDFNTEPVLSDWFQIYAHSNTRISSILDLENRKVAVLENSVQADTISRMIVEASFDCDVVRFKHYDLAFAMVNDGQVDAVIVNRFYGKREITNFANIEETGIVFHPTRLHFAATRGKHAQTLEAIDNHLRRWKKLPSSVYYKTIKTWTGESPSITLPKYAKAAGLVLVGALALALGFLSLLRWRVRTRTMELHVRTEELQRTLDELRLASRKMQQQERLHAMGQMACGIAHDFSNILVPILGYTDLLLSEMETHHVPEHYIRYLKIMREAGRNGASIVQRMKTFYRTRNEAHKAEPVDMAALIRNTVEMTRPRWEVERKTDGNRLEVQMRLQPVPKVMGHADQLGEVLINILFNAIDAMPRGGTVVIALKKVDGNVRIRVTDAGEGMSREVLANCARPFFTTKGEQGTGMGLAIATEIIDAHGGRIEIRSQPGKGTEISLLLPPCLDGARPGRSLRADPNATDARRLLVVMADPHPLETLVTILRNEGHDIVSVSSIEDAIHHATGKRFDAVFYDSAIPDGAGYKFFSWLRTSQPHVSIVILDGNTADFHREPMAADDNVSVITKPVTRSDLRRVLAKTGRAEPPSAVDGHGAT